MGRVKEIVKKYGIVDMKEFRNYLNRYNDLTDLDSLAKAYIEYRNIRWGWGKVSKADKPNRKTVMTRIDEQTYRKLSAYKALSPDCKTLS